MILVRTRRAGFSFPHCASLLACIVAALLAGCKANDTAPSPGRGDWYPAPMNDPQISVLSPELRPWLGFQPAIVIEDGQRPLHVEVPMRNTTYNKYLIEYRFLFYDGDGREEEPAMGWKMQALEPKQIVRLKAGALNTDAETYRLEVKWSR